MILPVPLAQISQKSYLQTLYCTNICKVFAARFHGYIYIGLGLWCLTPRSTIFQNYISWQSVLLVEGIH